ncbi:hypothetical protein N9A72_00480 [bacterium]|nr:hypothetical protein [bacterium]
MQKIGAITRRKGKYYFIFLVLNKGTGTRNYEQVYGQYIREQEAKKICQRQNKATACSLCQFVKDCSIAK